MAISLDELAAQYGYAAAFFNSDPELHNLIQQATTAQWTPERFRAAFMATNWYRTNLAAQRQWAELEARDPREVWNRVEQQKLKIGDRITQQGIQMSWDRLTTIARDSLRFGWNEEQLSQALEYEYQYKPGDTAGGTAALETKIKQQAADYGVTVSDAQFDDWIGGVIGQRYTEDNLNDFMRDLARGTYPGLKDRIDQGFTVRQIAAPYIQSYSKLMETDEPSVTLDDPLIKQALQGTTRKDSPTPVTETVYEFEQRLRKDPRWLKTGNAKEATTNATLGVLKDWGIVA